MSAEVVKILDGNTFVVSDGRGDIEASPGSQTAWRGTWPPGSTATPCPRCPAGDPPG
jgi:hypothetical protein